MSSRALKLHRDEEVVARLHPHWIVLLKGVVLLLVAIAVGIWVYLLNLEDLLGDAVRVGASVLIIVTLLYFLQRWAVWFTSTFVVTTDRCILRTGVFSRRRIEIPLERIDAVVLHQGLRGRLLRTGSLTIELVGDHGVQTITDVRDPVTVQQLINEQMEGEALRAGARPLSIADELAKLADLRDAGHLSDEEFRAQKQRLLTPPGVS